MNDTLETLTAKEAMERNLVRLTEPYYPHEQWMLDNAIKNIQTGKIVCALVKTKKGEGIELWRSRNGFLDTKSQIRNTKKPEFGIRVI